MNDMTLSLDPAWPWALPGAGGLALAGVALVLVALTLWTYLGQRGASVGRVSLLVLLRLLALGVTILVLARPSLGYRTTEGLDPSQLLVVIDASDSMNVADDFGSQTRWANACRIWTAPSVVQALERLKRDEKVETILYQGAADLKPFDPNGPAKGRRTDIGAWLHELWTRPQRDGRVRGVLICSDGANNGTRFAALDLARQWRGKAPVHTFGHGNPDDAHDRRDVAIAQVRVSPSPVPVKTRLTVRATVQAPGFAGAGVEASVWLQGSSDAKPSLALTERVFLRAPKDNTIALTCDAPGQAGEYKVTVKLRPLPEEATTSNNEASTYVIVTREGVRVLWVEGRKRAYEPTFVLNYALGPDPRYRAEYAEPPPPGKAEAGGDWYDLTRRPYDVLIIGDVSAAQFAAGDPDIFAKIKRLVQDRKMGLLLLGGTDAFAAGGWDRSPLAELMPVALNQAGWFDGPARVLPDPRAPPLPFLHLGGNPEKDRAVWDRLFEPLDGVAHLGSVRPGATVLARRGDEEPVLVAGRSGGGRVLVFGGDTTWKAWRRSPEAIAAYTRFWRQAILWLAQQEEGGSHLWVELDRRRLAATGNDPLNVTFGLRGKNGAEIGDASFTAKVRGPQSEEFTLAPIKDAKGWSSMFPGATAPGEYRVIVTGKGKDTDGSLLDETRSARFAIEAEDVENLNPGADHEFLSKLAAAGGGRFARADEQVLLHYLDEVRTQAQAEGRTRLHRWPDWEARPATDRWPDQLAGLWGSAAIVCFLAFATLLCLEWGLRRWWGWV